MEEEIDLRHFTFEIPARHPSEDVKWEDGYVILLERVKVQDEDLQLELTSLWINCTLHPPPPCPHKKKKLE